MDNTKIAYDKLKKRVAALKSDGKADSDIVDRYIKKFIELVGNDINTSSGLTLLYEVLKDDISDATKLAVIEEFDKVLSLDLTKQEEKPDVSGDVSQEELDYINERIAARAAAKKEKNFALADDIRNELLEKGISIKDTREGVVWERV